MFGKSNRTDNKATKADENAVDGAIEVASEGDVVVYQPDSQTKIEARIVSDTIWLSQKQIADLFMTSKQDVSYHISNAIKEELRGFEVVKDFLTTAEDGKCYTVKHYNLDAILSVGYRIKSPRGIQFRQWANGVLKIQLLTGRAAASVPAVVPKGVKCSQCIFARVSEDGRCECHVARPTKTGFPSVNADDFCSLHVNAISGKRTFASYVTPGYQVC